MSIPHKSTNKTIQEILKPLFQYYKERELKLARMLYKRGATYSDIARELDITPQAVRYTYPKNDDRKERGGGEAA